MLFCDPLDLAPSAKKQLCKVVPELRPCRVALLCEYRYLYSTDILYGTPLRTAM